MSNDDFYRAYNSLAFTVDADLFIPAEDVRRRSEAGEKRSGFRINAEANRLHGLSLGCQFVSSRRRHAGTAEEGVVIMRDASANKCGVIRHLTRFSPI